MACVGLAYYAGPVCDAWPFLQLQLQRPPPLSAHASPAPPPFTVPDHTIGGGGGAGNARRLTIYVYMYKHITCTYMYVCIYIYIHTCEFSFSCLHSAIRATTIMEPTPVVNADQRSFPPVLGLQPRDFLSNPSVCWIVRLVLASRTQECRTDLQIP